MQVPSLTLYGLPASRCTQTVRFALNEKRIPFRFVPVNVRVGEGKRLVFKTPAHLAHHPFGKIPVLEVGDGNYFFESIAICTYVDAISTPTLVPSDALAALAVNQWVSSFTYNVYPPAYKLKLSQLAPLAPDLLAAVRAQLTTVLAAYGERLGARDYIAGDAFTLADLVHVPYLNVVVATQPDLVVGNVRAWFERCAGRPAWKEVMRFAETAGA